MHASSYKNNIVFVNAETAGKSKFKRAGVQLNDRNCFLVESALEGGYIARALGHAIFTEGDNLPALHMAVQKAVRCHFDVNALPKLIRLHFLWEALLAVRGCPAT